MTAVAFVYLFGVLVIVMYGMVAGLVSVPLAGGVSYAPYILYALLGKRPKLRALRQFGVFAVAWLIATAALTFAALATGEFSAQGGPIEAFGVDIFSTWLLGGAAAAIPPVFLGGELVLFLLRRRLPPEEEPPTGA